ncbi:MAG: ATPase [Alphaproteobacteria bacterium]|nr:MAG: ATPase [Alphaproteobacteria bacterium]
MSLWKPKRFWKETNVAEAEGGGFTVLLDTRPVRTPAKAPMTIPTRALAEAVAEEWEAQEGEVRPETMPLTRMVNSAIDMVSQRHGEVADMLAAYGETDLLCHRAEAPAELVRRQEERWDPLLDWAAEALGARLVPVTGVIASEQDPQALAELKRQTHALDAFELAAFHDLVSLTGSLILGFAAARGVRTAEEIWALSRIDEDWQAELWGEDEEAAEQAELKRRAFLDAHRAFLLLHAT